MIIKQLFVPPGLRNHPGRDMRVVEYVTIHETGNTSRTATAKAHAEYQHRGSGGREASWHYTVDGAEIWQSFRDHQMCWHTGTPRGNERSIGIEICVNSREEYYRACQKTAELAADLLKRYGLGMDKLAQHHCWSGKNCPAQLRSGNWGLSWPEFVELTRKFFMKNFIKSAKSAESAESAEGAESAILIPVSPSNSGEPEEVRLLLDAMTRAGVDFQRDHWSEVFSGARTADIAHFKVLCVRVIDGAWSGIGADEMTAALKALLMIRR